MLFKMQSFLFLHPGGLNQTGKKIYIYHNLQVWKWVLWPYILLELLRMLIILAILIVGLVTLKDKIDLGLVIGITIAYGFAFRKKTFEHKRIQ